MHVANLYGEDKVSFDDRVAFVEQNLDKVSAREVGANTRGQLVTFRLLFRRVSK